MEMLIIIALLLAIIASALLFGAHITLLVLGGVAVVGAVIGLINKAQESSVPTTTPEERQELQRLVDIYNAQREARLHRKESGAL